jgi:cobalt-zinc-cadmium efflux system outer membrane protein
MARLPGVIVLLLMVVSGASCAGSASSSEELALSPTRTGGLERAGGATERPSGEERPPERLTIEQAVDEALRRNLTLLAQRLNLSVADAAIVAARIRPNPVLSLDVDHVNVAHLSKGDLTEAAARVDVPIVLGGKRDLRIEVAEADRRIAEVQLEDAVRKLRQDVASACVDLIQARANLELARDNLNTFEDLVRINDKRAQAGAIAPSDLTRSKVAMLQFRSGVRRAELEMAGARTRLRTLLGRGTSGGEVDLADDLAVTPSDQAVELSTLSQKAFATRPDLRALELGQVRAESDIRLQVANGIVDLSAGAEYRWNADEPSERLVGVFVSVPIPFWNQNAGEIARARAQRLQAARQLDALRSDIAGDVRAAVDEFASARELVRGIEGELLQSARQVRDAESRRYQSGATSFLDFIDAQRAFNDARQSLNDARATYRRAVIRLNSAVGSEVIR